MTDEELARVRQLVTDPGFVGMSKVQELAAYVPALLDEVERLRKLVYEHHAALYTRWCAGTVCPVCEKAALAQAQEGGQ